MAWHAQIEQLTAGKVTSFVEYPCEHVSIAHSFTSSLLIPAQGEARCALSVKWLGCDCLHYRRKDTAPRILYKD